MSDWSSEGGFGPRTPQIVLPNISHDKLRGLLMPSQNGIA
jgi:hypothetical protein